MELWALPQDAWDEILTCLEHDAVVIADLGATCHKMYRRLTTVVRKLCAPKLQDASRFRNLAELDIADSADGCVVLPPRVTALSVRTTKRVAGFPLLLMSKIMPYIDLETPTCITTLRIPRLHFPETQAHLYPNLVTLTAKSATPSFLRASKLINLSLSAAELEYDDMPATLETYCGRVDFESFEGRDTSRFTKIETSECVVTENSVQVYDLQTAQLITRVLGNRALKLTRYNREDDTYLEKLKAPIWMEAVTLYDTLPSMLVSLDVSNTGRPLKNLPDALRRLHIANFSADDVTFPIYLSELWMKNCNCGIIALPRLEKMTVVDHKNYKIALGQMRLLREIVAICGDDRRVLPVAKTVCVKF